MHEENTRWQRWFIVSLLLVLLVCYRFFFWRAAANNVEFLSRSLFGKDFLDGILNDFFSYRIPPHDGSMVLGGIIAAVLFPVLGDSFFSLYLIALLFPIAILILLYNFSLKYFGADVAIVASILYVLSPFQYLVYTTIEFGSHIDSALFILLALCIFYKIFFTSSLANVYHGNPSDVIDIKKNKRKLLILFSSLGIISGIATSICYSFLAALFILLFSWFVIDIKFFRKKYFYIFLFSFFLMLSPLLIHNCFSKFKDFFEGNVISGPHPIFSNLFLGKGSNWIVTWHCLKHTVFEMFRIEPFLSLGKYTIPPFLPRNIFYNLIFLAMFVSALSGLKLFITYLYTKIVKRYSFRYSINDFLKEGIILSYIIFFMILYCLYDEIWPTINYFYPAYPFIYILVGLLVKKCKGARYGFIKLRSISIFLVALILLSGFYFCRSSINTVSSFDIGSFKNMFRLKGYSHACYSGFFTHRAFNDIFISDGRLGTLEPSHEEVFYDVLEAWFFSDTQRMKNWEDIDKNYKYLRKAKRRSHPIYCIRLGITIGDGLHKETIAMMPLKIKTFINDEYHPFIYEGIAISYCNRLYEEVLRGFESGLIDRYIPDEFLHYFYAQLGRRICERYKGNYIQGIMFLEKFPKEYHPYLYLGFTSSFSYEELIEFLHIDGYPINPLLIRYSYFYLGKYFWGGCENYPPECLKSYIKQVPEGYVRECVWGIIYGFYEDFYFLEYNDAKDFVIQVLSEIKKEIFNFNINESIIPYIYQGFGISISLRTFGELSFYDTMDLEAIVPQKYRNNFYEGYGVGLFLRYGNNKERINELSSKHIPPEYKNSVIQGWDLYI
ncbi:MAG: hypothetical protein DRP84_01400 [Spirochaetes bacterium]|nr:MAG: hypothetical protein DRP84_01400 [Spirochaetota bacterium]